MMVSNRRLFGAVLSLYTLLHHCIACSSHALRCQAVVQNAARW
jgi:hypothetical protein